MDYTNMYFISTRNSIFKFEQYSRLLKSEVKIENIWGKAKYYGNTYNIIKG